jgi:hypothetical protein
MLVTLSRVLLLRTGSMSKQFFMGNWVTRILPRFQDVPKGYREQHGWPLDYFIEIRDIEYEDFLDDMAFSMLDFQ